MIHFKKKKKKKSQVCLDCFFGTDVNLNCYDYVYNLKRLLRFCGMFFFKDDFKAYQNK